MCRICKAILVLGALMMVNVGVASDGHWDFAQDQNANLCFEETVKVANGAAPESLSTVYCDRALRVDPLGRKDKSAMLHNRGIIQKAQGDLAAAQSSFDKAVSLSTTVDRRNLALAEVARERGDYNVAREQYDLLASSAFASESDDVRFALLARRQEASSAYFASVERTQACVGCHGVDGISATSDCPTLAGRSRDYLEHALRQFKSGERHSEVMTAQAGLIVDEDIPLLAGYFASLDSR